VCTDKYGHEEENPMPRFTASHTFNAVVLFLSHCIIHNHIPIFPRAYGIHQQERVLRISEILEITINDVTCGDFIHQIVSQDSKHKEHDL